MANEWPDEDGEFRGAKKKAAKKRDSFIDEDEKGKAGKKKKKPYGPLMDIAWYRVVLDEAQYVRVNIILTAD